MNPLLPIAQPTSTEQARRQVAVAQYTQQWGPDHDALAVAHYADLMEANEVMLAQALAFLAGQPA